MFSSSRKATRLNERTHTVIIGSLGWLWTVWINRLLNC